MSSKIIFENSYAWDDVCELGSNVATAYEQSDLDCPFLGQIKVLMWYEPSSNEINIQRQKDGFLARPSLHKELENWDKQDEASRDLP